MKKKKVIIISVISLLIIICVSIVIFVFKKSIGKSDYDVNSIENKTRQVLDSVNYINLLISDPNFDINNKYFNEEKKLDCYKYTGDNTDIYLNVARTTYVKPFSSKSYFNLEIDQNNQEVLYVCKPKCRIKEVTMEDIDIKNKGEDNIIFAIKENQYTLKKENDVWKLNEPIIICEEE